MYCNNLNSGITPEIDGHYYKLLKFYSDNGKACYYYWFNKIDGEVST